MEIAALSASCPRIVTRLSASPRSATLRSSAPPSSALGASPLWLVPFRVDTSSCTRLATSCIATSACGEKRASVRCHVAADSRVIASREMPPSDATGTAVHDDERVCHVSDADRRQQTVAAIAASGIVACVRADSADVALCAARAALSAGIQVLEVTCTTPGAFQVIASLVSEFPHATIGAGTVLTPHHAMAARQAGARFLMSPATDPDLVASHAAGPLAFIPGVMTPTEILSASRLGAPLVKLFPAPYAGGEALLFPAPFAGGEALVRAMHRAVPSVGIVPAHGVQLDMIAGYIEAGATAVVLSDAIFQKAAIKRQNYDYIAQIATAAVEIAQKALLIRTQ